MATRASQRLRWAVGLAGVGVFTLTAAAGIAGYQALQARDALLRVADGFQQVSVDLRSGEAQQARESLEVTRRSSDEARENTSGILWQAGSHLPGIGDDVVAVRTVADVADDLADRVLGDVIDAGEVLDPTRLRPRNGRIPLEPVKRVAPSVVAADKELRRQAARIEAVETAGLVPQLAAPLTDMQARLGEAADLSSRASYAVRLLPSMLGDSEPRTYLVLFQNNAEVRATGGMPGALAVVRADRGRLTVEGQGTAGDLGYHDPPAVKLTRTEIALYERKLAMFAADLNFTPDFPRAAQIARAMWFAEKGQRVDGVLSADPVALSYLLDGTGPVRVPSGPPLTASNAVDLLLSEIYRTQPDAELQNLYFAAAARAVFDAVTAGTGDPATTLEGLSRAAGESRLYAWSSRTGEQRLLAQTALAGAVPREAEAAPYLGFFLNDGTAAKLQYYLEHKVDVEPTACNSAGRQQLEITVTLTSHAPRNAATLPPSVIGPREGGQGWFGVRPGHMRINAHLYAPIGGWIGSSAYDGEERPLLEVEHLGHPVGSRTVELAPGQTRELTYTVMTGLDQRGPVDLRVTPGVRSDGIGEVAPSVCAGR